MAVLNETELEVLKLVTTGFLDEEISQKLNIEVKEVEKITKILSEKLNAETRIKLSVKAVKERIV